jgi:hypothetical protein
MFSSRIRSNADQSELAMRRRSEALHESKNRVNKLKTAVNLAIRCKF